ncbi:MAG: flap endonuclease-1 [Thermoplasmata archaeon]
MGVDISSLVKGRTISLSDLSNRVVAIDAFNALYQFLSIIRQPDGTPLKNRDGEVTSHLSGLFYRCVNFLEAGVRPVFIFDGEPPALKRETIDQRISERREAEQAWQEALAEGDIRRAWSKATRASRLTSKMVDDSKKLLNLLGIPYVQAPSEGEAQASHMVIKGVAYASASQDFDSLLFGCPRLVRNLAISGKRRLPKSSRFVTVEPEEILLGDVLKTLGISREQLVDVAILIGTDFNKGIRGIGPKKSLALIRKYGSIEAAVDNGKIEAIELLEELRRIFLFPNICDVSDLKWGRIQRQALIEFMCDANSFSVDRINSAVDRIPEHANSSISTSLDRWIA